MKSSLFLRSVPALLVQRVHAAPGCWHRRLCVALAGVLVAGFWWGAQPVLSQQQANVNIINVDASGFPQVSVQFSAADGQGSLRSDLTLADLQIFEDGLRVPASAMTLESSDAGPVSLVVAVDVSAEPQDLARVQTGLLSLVDQLGPDDSMTLLAFFDEVELVQQNTSDKALLQNAINGLSAGGNFTALNEATIEALNRAQLLSDRQRAVVIVTDSVANNTAVTPQDLANAATSGGALDFPTYVVAFSPKVQAPGVMQSFADTISARLFLLNTATEAQLRLQTLSSLFGTGYDLTFLSSLAADGQPHTVSVSLAGQSGPGGRADAGFVAVPNTVHVSLPSLQNGQEVGGPVEIAPSIESNGPLATVNYVVDGEVVHSISQEPLPQDVGQGGSLPNFEWDSREVTPGAHVVGVQVEDVAGNQGEAYVTLHVVPALQLQAELSRQEAAVGSPVMVRADADAFSGIREVAFAVDGNVVHTLSEPPYELALDSGEYSEGEHTVTVRVTDSNGYMETSVLALSLTPRPPRFLFGSTVWLRVLAVATILLTGFLVWLLFSYLAAFCRRQAAARYRFELANQGNMASAYLLRADDPKGQLNFHFFMKGMPLRGRKRTEWVKTEPPPPSRSRVQRAPVSGGQLHDSAALGQHPGSGHGQSQNGQGQATSLQEQAGGLKGKASGQMDRLKGLSAKTSMFSGLMGAGYGLLAAVGRALPASMGGDVVYGAAMKMRGAYAQTKRVEMVNKRMDQTSTMLAGQMQSAQQSPQQWQEQVAARAEGAKQAVAAPGGQQQDSGGQQQQQAPMPQQALPSTAEDPGGRALPVPAGGYPQAGGGYANGSRAYRGRNGSGPIERPDEEIRYDREGTAYKPVTRLDPDSPWIETPEVEPGDTLVLELRVQPRNPRRSRTYPVRLSSKAVEEPGSPVHQEETKVKIKGASALYWLILPALITLVAVVIVAGMSAYLLNDLGLLSLEQLRVTLFS